MFRTENNVPFVYPNLSRDFQMFCRTYDVIFQSTRFSIESLSRTSNTSLCSSQLLELLKNKIGFLYDVNISDKELRYLIDAFPHIIKYKGSITSIVRTINLFQRIWGGNEATATYIVDKENKVIIISFNSYVDINGQLLKDIMTYIAPTGYQIEMKTSSTDTVETSIHSYSEVSGKLFGIKEYSVIPDVSENQGEFDTALILLTEQVDRDDKDYGTAQNANPSKQEEEQGE